MRAVKQAFLRWLVNPTENNRLLLNAMADGYECACNHVNTYDPGCIYCNSSELAEVPRAMRSNGIR